MSNFCSYGFRNFCINNFPFIEKEFDALTDYELIKKIFEHFEKEINEIETKYEDILNIRQEFEDFKVQVEQEFAVFAGQINDQVDSKLNENYNRIVALMSDYQTLFNNELESLRNDLEHQIEEIELGNVMAYNPTNGQIENVSKVIMDVYDLFRTDAITASEFDALELTATAFDATEITANEFDLEAKTILTNL